MGRRWVPVGTRNVVFDKADRDSDQFSNVTTVLDVACLLSVGFNGGRGMPLASNALIMSSMSSCSAANCSIWAGVMLTVIVPAMSSPSSAPCTRWRCIGVSTTLK
eukprot:FR740169.1.p1 GENE.FR740169.1~~FR740169.1.p1  ORF type:complete len:105 (-),score=1.93 FR740169.1:49-363(-)